MAISVSDGLRDAGRNVASSPADDFATLFNVALTPIFAGFYVGPGTICDADGACSAPFDSLISLEAPNDDGTIRADAVACAAYLCHALDAESLKQGYVRIARMRTLRKTPSANPAQSTITLGVIVAAKSVLSLDKVAENVQTLSGGFSDYHRPDMVTILSEGTVSYAMAFLGDERVGAFLPPAQVTAVIPPSYIHLVTTTTSTHGFNKLIGFISGHLAFYAPGTARPDMPSALEGVPKESAIIWTYQYNLAGKLVDAITLQSHTPSYRIEDRKKTLLSKLRLQPWQDGGVVVSDGPQRWSRIFGQHIGFR